MVELSREGKRVRGSGMRAGATQNANVRHGTSCSSTRSLASNSARMPLRSSSSAATASSPASWACYTGGSGVREIACKIAECLKSRANAYLQRLLRFDHQLRPRLVPAREPVVECQGQIAHVQQDSKKATYWAGDAVTVARERSRTLICDETWACEDRKGAALRARQDDGTGVEKRIP